MTYDSKATRGVGGGTRLTTMRFVILGLMVLCSATSAMAQDMGTESLRESGRAFADIARSVSPAVVYIQVDKVVERQAVQDLSPFNDDLFQRFFGAPPSTQGRSQQRHATGQGSGFLISEDGYILTNNHVVDGADKVTVRLEDGREFTAKTVGTDAHADVAVVKVDAKNLPVLQLGDSDRLQVGEWVVAIGNPFGLSHTLTAGIVSAKGRNAVGISDYEDFIQTDAAINPGNSGGPLVNLSGEVVGMNTAIFSRTGGYMGIGFAIPVNMAKEIARQLIETGTVTRGYLGVMIQPLTPDLAEGLGIDVSQGVLVADVSEDSPAAKAGLKSGDVVVEFDGVPVATIGEFRNMVSTVPPGTSKSITVLRDSKRKNLTVVLGKLQDDNVVAATEQQPMDELGLAVEPLTPERAEQFGIQQDSGVVISEIEPGSAAAEAHLRPGMVIDHVGRSAVSSVKDFQQAITKERHASSIMMRVKDGKFSHYVVVRMG